MTFPEFQNAFNPEYTGLHAVLKAQAERYMPDGWLIAQNMMFDSSGAGEKVILPFGGSATLQSVPDKPFSPRGAASDMSEVIGVLLFKDFISHGS